MEFPLKLISKYSRGYFLFKKTNSINWWQTNLISCSYESASSMSSLVRVGLAIILGLFSIFWFIELRNFLIRLGLFGNISLRVCIGIDWIPLSSLLKLCTLSTTVSPAVWGIHSRGNLFTNFWMSMIISSIFTWRGIWSSSSTPSVPFCNLLSGNFSSGSSIIVSKENSSKY